MCFPTCRFLRARIIRQPQRLASALHRARPELRHFNGDNTMTTGIGIDKATELSPKDFERLLLRTLTAMKKGDFSARMPMEFTGMHGKIADTLNDIAELTERTSKETERIANVVGKEGKLNQRAQ